MEGKGKGEEEVKGSGRKGEGAEEGWERKSGEGRRSSKQKFITTPLTTTTILLLSNCLTLRRIGLGWLSSVTDMCYHVLQHAGTKGQFLAA